MEIIFPARSMGPKHRAERFLRCAAHAASVETTGGLSGNAKIFPFRRSSIAAIREAMPDSPPRTASRSLLPILRPKSVAVIGASDTPSRIGGRPIHSMKAMGYGGRIYPVNPRRETVQGLAAFPSIRDVPEPVDCALIAVPAAIAVDALRDCAEDGREVRRRLHLRLRRAGRGRRAGATGHRADRAGTAACVSSGRTASASFTLDEAWFRHLHQRAGHDRPAAGAGRHRQPERRLRLPCPAGGAKARRRRQLLGDDRQRMRRRCRRSDRFLRRIARCRNHRRLCRRGPRRRPAAAGAGQGAGCAQAGHFHEGRHDRCRRPGGCQPHCQPRRQRRGLRRPVPAIRRPPGRHDGRTGRCRLCLPVRQLSQGPPDQPADHLRRGRRADGGRRGTLRAGGRAPAGAGPEEN